MTTAQILYGLRRGELVHIDEVERRLACECTCPMCNRALVARKGEVLSHFFAHAADEVNCNPSPESLVHVYAKQQVAKFSRLVLPGFDVHAKYQSNTGPPNPNVPRRSMYKTVCQTVYDTGGDSR